MQKISRRQVLRFGAHGGLTALAARLATPALAKNGPVKIGVILPDSGPLREFAATASSGIKLAAQQINKAGGIGGREVELLYRDDESNPATAAKLTRSLIAQDEVLAMLGPITSSAREAVAPIIEEQKTPLLYATDYEGGGCSPHLFFFHMVPNQSATPLMRYLVQQGGKSFFMLGADYVWPQKMFEACRTVLAKLGAVVSGERFVPLGDVQDYSSLIGDIRKKQPDVLVLALPGRVHVAFLEQARKAGLLSSLSLGVLADLQTYAQTFAVREGERMYACVPFVATGAGPGVRRFVADAKPFMTAAAAPTPYTMTHYNALMALRTALEGAGEVSREAALEGLPGMRYPIPTGESVIEAANHHSTLEAYISKAEGSRVEVVKDLGALAPKPGCA